MPIVRIARRLGRLIADSLRWLLARLPALVAVFVARRVVSAVRSGRESAANLLEAKALPSLYDVHPKAMTAPRRRIGLISVPLDRIVGTLRHPSQNTEDFKPLPELRGANWNARWQRINRAMDRLDVLPPVELVEVGDEYYVADGHNRVAAAREAGAVEIDADVTQLLVPGVSSSTKPTLDATSLAEASAVRGAVTGRQSRTVEQPRLADEVPRRDLLRHDGEGE